MATERRQVKILLLEDRSDNAEAIKENLECITARNWAVTITSRLAEFEEKLAKEHFDIFIIDYDLPADRQIGKTSGGGERALEALQNSVGLVPAIVYSGVLKGELEEAEVIEKGASYILQKGAKGSALSALIQRILSESDEKLGFKLKAFFASRLGESTFYMDLLKEERVTIKENTSTKVTVEIQRLFDDKPKVFEVTIDKTGEVISAEQK
jgi:DNA-binding response OmpR family regulator